MIVKPGDYVPSLRWRTGEYQALFRLNDSAKRRIVPFIVIPEIEFDFEEWKDKKTVQEHVEPFPKRYKDKWGARQAWIDVHPKILAVPMDDVPTTASNLTPVDGMTPRPPSLVVMLTDGWLMVVFLYYGSTALAVWYVSENGMIPSVSTETDTVNCSVEKSVSTPERTMSDGGPTTGAAKVNTG